MAQRTASGGVYSDDGSSSDERVSKWSQRVHKGGTSRTEPTSSVLLSMTFEIQRGTAFRVEGAGVSKGQLRIDWRRSRFVPHTMGLSNVGSFGDVDRGGCQSIEPMPTVGCVYVLHI